MSAVYGDELKRMVQQYIDGDRKVAETLKQILKTTSAATRYSLIKDVRRGIEYSVLHVSAIINDLEMMKCLLHEFSSDQKWQVLKIVTSISSTPLHWAARNGSTDTAKYLLESTPAQFRYEYLQMKDRGGYTALHIAATYNHLQTAQVLLSFLSPQQQISLLKETNNNNQSVADRLSTKYPQDFGVRAAGMVIALEDKLAEQQIKHEREMKDQKDELNTKLTEQKVEHGRALEAANQKLQDKLAGQKVEHDREMQAMKEKQAELERKLAQLDVYLHQTIDTNDVGNQEAPHSD